MDTVIGLGKAGCAIADKFAKYSQYLTYKLDVDLPVGPRSFVLARQQKIEDYEENCPDLTKFFDSVEADILFVIGGGGRVSSSALAILKQLKHCNINVMYIKPDLSFGGATEKLLDKMTFNVLQQYARSGVFERLYLIDNEQLEKVIPPTSVKNYYDNLNEAIVSTFHMINVFNHVDPVTDTFSDPPIGARISTIGFVNPKKNDDQMFFLLDNVSDMVYYYGYNKMKLEEGNNLLSQVKNSIIKKTDGGVRVSYGIFETDYEQDYIYILNHSSVIQGEEQPSTE